MKHRLFICLFLAALAVFASTEYRLGGGALAKIDETNASTYQCLVSFSPVATMDAISNREMNRIMAQFLAEEALEKHLGKPCVVSFSRTSSTVKEMEKTYEYLFDIPKDAISFDVKVTSSQTAEKRPLSREDARQMILAARSRCFRDVTLAEAYIASLTKEPPDKRRREELITMLKKLEESIEEDDNLFTREKRVLKQRVQQLKATLPQK